MPADPHPQELTATQRYSPPDGVLFRDLGGEAVVLEVRSGLYFGLDEVGTRIWHLLLDHLDVEQIGRRLVAEFAVEPDRLQHDLRAFIAELLARGLLVADPPA